MTILILLVFILLSGLTSSVPRIEAAQCKLDSVLSNITLTEQQKDELKTSCGRIIHKDIRLVKNDYVDDSNRGTAEFNPEKGNKFDEDNLKVRNYAYHKVIIPDGTTVEGVNFTQAVPHTSAVAGKNLTFINCNLVNVEIDPTWTLTNSNNTQVRTRTITVGNQQFVVKEVEKITDNWVEVSREEIIAP